VGVVLPSSCESSLHLDCLELFLGGSQSNENVGPRLIR